jgi:hypothetical protein
MRLLPDVDGGLLHASHLHYDAELSPGCAERSVEEFHGQYLLYGGQLP